MDDIFHPVPVGALPAGHGDRHGVTARGYQPQCLPFNWNLRSLFFVIVVKHSLFIKILFIIIWSGPQIIALHPFKWSGCSGSYLREILKPSAHVYIIS